MALEFTLKLLDLMSSKMNTPISKVNQLTNVSTAYTKQQQASAKTVVKSYQDMNMSLGQYKTRLEQVKHLMENTRNSTLFSKWKKDASELQNHIKGMEGGKGGIMSMLSGFAKPLLAAASIGSVVALGMSSVSAANQFGAQKKSYEVLTGNAGIGGQLAEDLRGLKENTILGPAVYKNAQTMLGFGISASEVTKDLKMLGAVSMGDANRLQHLTLAFSEVEAQGRLTGKEVRQFVNAGFNPLMEISRATGKSMATVREEMRKGAISSLMVHKAFESATGSGGRFHGMLEKMAETNAGKVQILQGKIASFKIALGERLQPGSSGLVDTLTHLVSWGKKLIEIPVTQKLTDQIAKIRSLQAQITSSNVSHQRQIEIYRELESINPNLVKGISEQNIQYEKLSKNIDNVTGSLQKKIFLERLTDQNLNMLTQFGEAQKKLTESFADVMIIVGGFPNIANRTDLTDGQKQMMVRNMLKGRVAADPKHGYITKGGTVSMGIGHSSEESILSEDLKTLEKINSALYDNKKAGGIESALMPGVQKFNQTKGFLEGTIEKYSGVKSMTAAQKNGGGVTGIDDLKAGAEGAMRGQKTITININRGLVEKLELHTVNMKEGMHEIEQVVKEVFLRIVNSANGMEVN